jgi:alkylhydroperoxidase/carboxymuconolactone decarboxylase family protein YurZ
VHARSARWRRTAAGLPRDRLRAGASLGEVLEVLAQVAVCAGVPRAINAVAVARRAIAEYEADPT